MAETLTKEEQIEELKDSLERGEELVSKRTKVRVPIENGQECWDKVERSSE